MPRTGRPKKADGGLCNDLKVRVDDKTLLELNWYCTRISRNRADVIREAIIDLVRSRTIPTTMLDAETDAEYYIATAVKCLDYAGELVKITLEDGGLSAHGNEVLIKHYLEKYSAIDNSTFLQVVNNAISELNK